MSQYNNDMSQLLFEIADVLSIKIVYDTFKKLAALTGESEVELAPMEGLTFSFKPQIEDSGIYSTKQKAAVLTHIAGYMYLLVLVERDKSNNEVTLFVIDGAKLGWSKKYPILLFPEYWDRVKLYKKIVDGVVAIYSRTKSPAEWAKVENGQQMIRDYLEKKTALYSYSSTAATGEVGLVKETGTTLNTDGVIPSGWGSILDTVSKFKRTIGPRGV